MTTASERDPYERIRILEAAFAMLDAEMQKQVESTIALRSKYEEAELDVTTLLRTFRPSDCSKQMADAFIMVKARQNTRG